MSGYEKSGIPSLNGFDARRLSQAYAANQDYDTSRSSSDGSYNMYTTNGLGESPSQPESSQMNYGANSFYQPRSSYDSSRSSFDEYGMRKAPEVKSYNPTRGSRGSPVYVFLRSMCDLECSPALIVSLMFATRRVPATLTRLEAQGLAFEYCVTADAPNFSETESTNTQIQLRLHLQDHSGQDATLVDVGYFQYVSNVLGSSPQEGSRKRKLSIDPNDVSSRYGDHQVMNSAGGYGYARNLQSSDMSSLHRRYSSQDRAQHRYRDITSRRNTQEFAMSPPNSRSILQNGSQSSVYNPSYLMSNVTTRGLALDPAASSASHSNPPLIRTSTIQQPTPSATTATTAAFNPYAMYPQKAVLRLRGNLNGMTENWTPEEWTAKRRLVQFWRSQNKSTINAEFAPLKPEERQPSSIVISCIWWEERQECFATSVDTIYLLEQLVALRFTVEEKNRIRRNLEGFKPLTVAKGKADSEEFFKVIMGFPNPKPRNIEKDVKVFEWKILAGALKKIMSKYSASYSSTAGTLPQNRNAIYTGYSSDPGVDVFNRANTRSASNSTASSNYATAGTLKSNTISPRESIHAIPSHYSDSGPLSATGSYVSPALSSFGHHQRLSSYAESHQLPGMSNPFGAPIERSRSSQGPSITDPDSDFLRFAKRPRANTTAIAPIYSSSPSGHLTTIDTTGASLHGGSLNPSPGPMMPSPAIVSSSTSPNPSTGGVTAGLPPRTPTFGGPVGSFTEPSPQPPGGLDDLSSLPGQTEPFPLLAAAQSLGDVPSG